MKRLIAALCALAIVTLPFPTAQAGANRSQQGFVLLLTVNTTDDHNDSNCDATDCTLREAMFAANDVSTHDIINFSVTGVINLVAPLPVISDGVTIQGPGADMLTVRRDPAWGDFRIFDVTSTETVNFSGLTISNGVGTPVVPNPFRLGGGINNRDTGTVNVTNCTVNFNNAEVGGGIYNRGILNVTNSTISDNFAQFGGGGIFNEGTGTVTVTDSIISDNVSARGGGIGNSTTSTMTVVNSTISDNSAIASGGGIVNSGSTLNVTNSTISNNSALEDGGGIRNIFGGTLNVTNSTISNNSASFGGGGGIFNSSGTVTVTNSTLSGNFNSFGNNGGISNNGLPVNVHSTIIALNTALGSTPDVSGPFTSHGFNLIGKTNGSTGFVQPTDQTGTIASPLDPRLDPAGPQDNGGPTRTIALQPDSPAIDKGTANGLTGTLTTDQRGTGFPRTVDDPAIPPATGGDNTDIGAFELALPAPSPITAGNALLINESCPPANGAIDPGERATVNLELINTSSAATSNLVAALQSSGGVLAPSGPQNYGAIAVNSSGARDFSFTAEGGLTSGQTITATLQLQDGATSLGTVSFNFTAGPTPCSFVRLVVSSSLSRADASTVVGAITVQNIGSLPANNVTLTIAKLGATNGTPLPQGLGNLAPGALATVMVNFSNSTPGASSMLTVGGTYSGGSFSSNKRVTIPACTPGAPGCGWEDGDMVTYNQDSWGGDPGTSTAATLLASRFDFVYAANGLELGINGPAGFSMVFTSAAAVLAYQPSSGGPGPLNADLVDPTSSSSGIFGGFLLALQLDVDFSDSGDLNGTSGLRFGDLRLCGLTATPTYDGMTVRQFLAAMNRALGGDPVVDSYDDLAILTRDVSEAFESGSVSLFAQQHVVSGPCQ